jgi:hypothetical protein
MQDRTRQALDFFNECSLTREDFLYFCEILKQFLDTFGTKNCWCLKRVLKGSVQHFSTSHSTRPLFKRTDARPLVLAAVGRYSTENNFMMVRRHECGSVYCINPNHFYWGTKQDVCLERGWRKNSKVTPELIKELRLKYESENTSLTSLAKSYKLPYHVVRNICRYISYV